MRKTERFGKREFLQVLVIEIAFAMMHLQESDIELINSESIIYKLSQFLTMDTDIIKIIIYFIAIAGVVYIATKVTIGLKRKVMYGILAFGMSVSLFTGRAFEQDNELETMFTGSIQSAKSIFTLTGYALFFFYLLKVGIYCYERYMADPIAENVQMRKSKFMGAFIFIAFAVSWSLMLWIYYPAIFMGDTEDIVYMAFNYETGVSNTVDRINSDIYITNHHPIAYTLLIGLIMKTIRKLGG